MTKGVAEGELKARIHPSLNLKKKETVSSLTAGILNDVQAWPQQQIQQYRAMLRRSRNETNIVGSC